MELATRERIGEAVQAGYPLAGESKVRNFAAQLNRLVNTIEVGDLVVLPRKVTSGVAIGKVTGGYVFDANGLSRHTRTVRWMKEAVPRQTFAQDLRFSLGAFMTVCEIKRNEALARVQAILEADFVVNAALELLSREFSDLYSPYGRASIAPEKLLRALLVQAFFGIRSERQLMDQVR